MLMGCELAVKSMFKKEKASFLINSDYMFGPLGCPPRIPPSANVYARIELRDFAQEGEAEFLLAQKAGERMKGKTYDDIEKVFDHLFHP